MFDWLSRVFQWSSEPDAPRASKALDMAVLSDVREKVEYDILFESTEGRARKDQAAQDLAAWAQTQPHHVRRLYLGWIDYFQKENQRRDRRDAMFREADSLKAGLRKARQQ